MSKATNENKVLAKIALEAFRGSDQSRVFNYLDNDEILSIPILICPDSPEEGITSYSTIGLSDYPMLQNGVEFPVRLEIIGVGDSNDSWFANVLSTCAFYIMRSSWLCCPGTVLQDVVNLYSRDSSLQHIYFTSPFFWENLSKTTELETKNVSWLLALPISDSEYQYLKKNGDNEFEELLESTDVNIFNLKRSSIL
jgi:antitoxin YqcF